MVHTFSYKHQGGSLYFLWDIESGSLHHVDYVAFLYGKKRYGIAMDQQENEDYAKISDKDIEELSVEFEELEKEGSLNAPQAVRNFIKKAGELKALCLHICHDCNMRCDYCFAGCGTYHSAKAYMSAETGKRAIDFLIKNSGIKKNLEVDFFGGEPLMNMKAVKEIVAYAKERGKQEGKEFSFTMTTNGVLLNKENIDYLNAEMDNVVLSIDGRPETHNAVRHAVSGKDMYDHIMKNFVAFKEVRGNKKYYVRGTFTAKNLDFSKDIFHLCDCGFDQISVEPVVLPAGHPLEINETHLTKIIDEYEHFTEGYLERRRGGKWFNFFHFMIDLHHGPCVNKRLTGCGAGTEYLAVSPEGDLYPCHQFVGLSDYLIGNVDEGVKNQNIREQFAAVTVLKKEHCAACAAKYYCGGGCAANAVNFSGSLDGQYKLGCDMAKKRLELSLAAAFIEGETLK